MAVLDLPLEELRRYLPDRQEPPDFLPFWVETLAHSAARRRRAQFTAAYPELRGVEVMDVTFSGFDGDPIRGWLILPLVRAPGLPVVVEYVGYGGGRGVPSQWLHWPACGFASFVMDTRGQGGASSAGSTPDPQAGSSGPQHPGFLTRGIHDPRTYYYRRLFTDAVLAVDAAREHPAVGDAIVVAGGSQGGGMALAVAALASGISAALIDVPFLSHIRRAIELSDEDPYVELRRFLGVHKGAVEDTFRTLAYFDGLNLAARSHVPALFSVGLMDAITPPSTIFAAYNHYAGPKRIDVFPYSGHEAGGPEHLFEKIRFLAGLGSCLRTREGAHDPPAARGHRRGAGAGRGRRRPADPAQPCRGTNRRGPTGPARQARPPGRRRRDLPQVGRARPGPGGDPPARDAHHGRGVHSRRGATRTIRPGGTRRGRDSERHGGG